VRADLWFWIGVFVPPVSYLLDVETGCEPILNILNDRGKYKVWCVQSKVGTCVSCQVTTYLPNRQYLFFFNQTLSNLRLEYTIV